MNTSGTDMTGTLHGALLSEGPRGQRGRGEQECDRQTPLGVSLGGRRGPDVPLPARAHLSALRLPLNGTLALDHLLFLHA